jgi:hypothetical protein
VGVVGFVGGEVYFAEQSGMAVWLEGVSWFGALFENMRDGLLLVVLEFADHFLAESFLFDSAWFG